MERRLVKDALAPYDPRSHCPLCGNYRQDLDLDALRQAVENEGPQPRWHRRIMRRHRRQWPTLWRAIDALLAAQEAE